MRRETFERLKAMGIPFDSTFEELMVEPAERLRKKTNEDVSPTVSFKDKKLKSIPENSKTLLIFFINGEYTWVGGTKHSIELTCDSKLVTFSTKSWTGIEKGYTIKTNIITKLAQVINIGFKIDGKETNSLNLVVTKIETKPDKSEKCICKKQSWTVKDLKMIVSQLRKKEPRGYRQHLDEKGNRLWLDKDGNQISSTATGLRPDEADKPSNYPYSQFEDFINVKTKEMYEDKIFFKDLTEELDSRERTYELFAENLNKVFNDKHYKINTCLRKIHFMAQIYHETEKFTKTFESRTNSGYSGGDDYVGRGMIHITNDFNYLRYFDHVNKTEYFELYKKHRLKIAMTKLQETVEAFNIRTENKQIPENIMVDLKKLSKLVASKMLYACDAAGWYWVDNDNGIDINLLADKDEILRVSAAVQHPNITFNKDLKAGDVGGYDERKKYYEYLKEIFDYENCK